MWEAINTQFGILSLSADPVQPVMWGHYADAYRGYVLGLDSTHPLLSPDPDDSDVTSRPRQVRYAPETPEVLISALYDENDREAFMVGAILTKHEAWA